MNLPTPELEEFKKPTPDSSNNVYFDYRDPIEIDTNSQAINNSIKNIILTPIGSLPGKPDFGSNINEYVFELLDGTGTSDLVKISILDALSKWEPRINVTGVDIKVFPEYNRITSNIYYAYNLLGAHMNGEVSIPLHD